MNGKETLAIIGIGAVSAGAFHAALQYDTMASARAQAITIEACGRAYDAPENNSGSPQEGTPGRLVDFATLADWQGSETAKRPSQDLALSLRPGHYVVTRATINCLDEGWVQNGESVDTSNIQVGESEVLLQAFAQLESSRGRHFDPSSVILWGLGGAAVGLFVAARLEAREERERKEASGEADTEATEDEEMRRRGIDGQGADPDPAD